MTSLPIPSAAALKHSETLMHVIHDAITEAGEYISFAHFMELALYAPGLGYYSAGNHKLGKEGDFITAPEISPLFAKCMAKQFQEILTELGSGDILEIGAGSGKFASDVLQELEQLDCLPNRYFILEISADLRERQYTSLQATCPQLLPRVHWLNTLLADGVTGIIFANELLDAMPVHCFQVDGTEIKERCVTVANNTLNWLSVPSNTALTNAVHRIQETCSLPNGYQSEINLMVPAWIEAIGRTLNKGVLLLLDYGYGQREYYHPDRTDGTLMCYYQHRRHSNPFMLVGLQDITANVNFTAVTESAIDANMQLAGYTTQASFLLALDIIDCLNQHSLTSVEQYQYHQAIKLLTLPSQMGELIKVIAFNKNIEHAWKGFSMHDRRRDL